MKLKLVTLFLIMSGIFAELAEDQLEKEQIVQNQQTEQDVQSSEQQSQTQSSSSSSQINLADLDLESLTADELQALIASGQLQQINGSGNGQMSLTMSSQSTQSSSGSGSGEGSDADLSSGSTTVYYDSNGNQINLSGQSSQLTGTTTTFQGETTTGVTTQYTTGTEVTGSEVLYSKPIITQTQQIVSKPVVTRKIISQPVITQRIVQQPIIKQRVVQTPIIRRQVVSRPVYTEREDKEPIVDSRTQTRSVPVNVPGKTTIREQYIQPTVLTKDVQLQVNRGQTQVNNAPVQTRPTQFSEEVVNRTVQAPAKEIWTQPIIQRQVINNTERVNFQKSEPQYQTREPIMREPILQERTRTQNVTRPGKEIYNQTYIQPIIQRENVDVQFNREEDRTVQMDPIVQQTQYNTQTRNETVQVPPNQIITQPVVQNYIEEREIHHVQTPVVQRVPIQRPFPVPTPVLKKVPVVRKIPVPVPNEENRGTKIVNLTRLSLQMPEDDSSEDSSEEQVAEGCGHSHYQGGYSWNTPYMNKWGSSGCNGCPLNFPSCAQGNLYNQQQKQNVIYKKNYSNNYAHGNNAFTH